MAAWREREDFQHLELSYWWRHRVRMTNLGENFFRHLRTFLGRFPGFEDEAHVESGFAFYLLSQEKGGPGCILHPGEGVAPVAIKGYIVHRALL